MAQCTTIKASGERCRGVAKAPGGFCWAHDPRNAQQRIRTASKAARSKPSREIRDLKKRLEDLASDVLEGRVERGDAVAVSQIANTIARLIELERKIREEEVLEGRIQALEEAQGSGRGGTDGELRRPDQAARGTRWSLSKSPRPGGAGAPDDRGVGGLRSKNGERD